MNTIIIQVIERLAELAAQNHEIVLLGIVLFIFVPGIVAAFKD